MTSLQALKEQHKYLTSLMERLAGETQPSLKLELFEQEPQCKEFLSQTHPVASLYPLLKDEERVAVASIAIIEQADNVFCIPEHLSDTSTRLHQLLEHLVLYEHFYQEIGGIVGYHLKILELICEKKETKNLPRHKQIHQAQGLSLHEHPQEANDAAIEGIRAMPYMGELYPIGGAGDRLNLRDEKTGIALPTAKLNYLGRSLLTCMVRDLQAREYLYFKIFNKQTITPIAMMTSEAKNNHHFVKQICQNNQWYHRPKDSFKLFMQPLAPVITENGKWSMSDHLQLYLKPSGHGVIWKLAKSEGILDWFKEHKRPKALLRQMNNPIAGTDNGILALIGIGYKENKDFGFASCQRLVHAAEGVNVLAECQKNNQYHYSITNIEYTEFAKYGVKDTPNSPNSPYSVFPSNTNILFIDFNAVEQALMRCAIPGMLINMKTKVPCFDESGNLVEVYGGRLESTMQNIADYMTDIFDCPQEVSELMKLNTFLTYNARHKTIAVAKKTYVRGKSIQETPESCYYTMLLNHFELLTKHCNFQLAPFPSVQEFLSDGPINHILMHPGLGTLYNICAQKIQKGRLLKHAELLLEISEIGLFNFELDGSCLISAETPLGHLREDQILEYSHLSGKCFLQNVQIRNRGINTSVQNVYWKNQIERHEKFQLFLEENAEFFAENVTFVGDYDIRVPKNTRMVATMDRQGQVTFKQFPISSPTWYWHYAINDHNQIELHQKKTS